MGSVLSPLVRIVPVIFSAILVLFVCSMELMICRVVFCVIGMTMGSVAILYVIIALMLVAASCLMCRVGRWIILLIRFS